MVSSVSRGRLNGQIANALIQVTARPPRLALSLNKGNFTHELISESGLVGVTVLGMDTPLKLIGRFGFRSGRDIEKFQGVEYRLGFGGVPLLLEHGVAVMAGRVVGELDVGTHTLFVVELEEAQLLRDTEPMTYAYYHRVKGGRAPEAAPTHIREERSAVMKKYRCKVCGYIYDPAVGDPDSGIEPGTPFEELPDDWVCPVCGAGKEDFEEV